VQAPRVTGRTFLTDLQIWGCELHKNAFGGRALPGPAGALYRSPQTPYRYKDEGRDGRRRKGLGIGRGEKGRKGNDANG